MAIFRRFYLAVTIYRLIFAPNKLINEQKGAKERLPT